MGMKERLHALMFFLLNDVGNKFDANALKSVVDKLFILSEKLVILFPSFLPYYINYYDDIIDKEIKVAQITKESSVLHVGCGSIPASSILIAIKTGAYVHGIDKDAKAVKKAARIIHQMEASFEVEFNDALTMNLSGFTVILISQGIQPKQSFLKELSKKLSSDQMVILRSFSSDAAIDETDTFLYDFYEITDIITHTTHGSTVTIIMKKK